MDSSATSVSIAARPRSAYVLPVILVGYMLAYLLVWLLVQGEGRVTTLDIMNVVGPLLAAALCIVVATKAVERRLVVFWSLLTTAMLVSALAEATWAFYELILDTESPFPSVADVFWLLTYPTQFAAVVALVWFRQSSRMVAIGVTLTAGFVALVAGTLMWLFIMLPSLDMEASVLTNLVTILYPAGDILLLSALAALAPLPRHGHMPKGMLWVAGSFIVMVVADVVYAVKELDGSYATGSWIDPLWPLAYILIAAAAAWQFMLARRATDG